MRLRLPFAPSLPRALAAALLACLAGGCDYVGLQPVSQIEARKEAEGRAIGGACRQAGRALEDCYIFNPHVPKAAIFVGWRDMNDYMQQNHLGVIKPEVEPLLPTGRARLDTASGVRDAAPPARLPAKAASLPGS